MGLDGLLQPAPIPVAPAGSAVNTDIGAAASADRHPRRGFARGAAIGAALAS
jgi:hypothetical protein